jgi:hypothetical protein
VFLVKKTLLFFDLIDLKRNLNDFCPYVVKILSIIEHTNVGGRKAQAGVVEFLILVLLMLFIFQQSLSIAAKTKEGGILLMEKIIVENSVDKLEFAIKELEFTGFGRKTIEVPKKPFIRYELLVKKEEVVLGAFCEEIKFNKTLDVNGKIICPPGIYENLTLIVENWGNGVKVIC